MISTEEVWHGRCLGAMQSYQDLHQRGSMRRFMLLPFALLSFAACHAPESNDEGVAEDDLTRRSSDTFSCETTKPFYDGKVHRIKFKVFDASSGTARA
jgi:hypothetical protein